MIKKINILKNIIIKVINESKFIMSMNKEDVNWYNFFYNKIFLKNEYDLDYGSYKYLLICDDSLEHDENGKRKEYYNSFYDAKFYIVEYNNPYSIKEVDRKDYFKFKDDNREDCKGLNLPNSFNGYKIGDIWDFQAKFKTAYELNISNYKEKEEDFLNSSNMSKNIEKKSKHVKIKNRQKYKSTLYQLAGPDTFMSFSDSYEVDPVTLKELIPKFSLNPNAEFNTPHGFYFYPFDKNNAKKFYACGMPTSADFAINRPYFHLVKVDLNNPKVLIINEDGSCNKSISSENFMKNVREIIRIHMNFFNKEINYKKIYKKLLSAYNVMTKYNYNQKMIENPFYQLYKFCFLLSGSNINYSYHGSKNDDYSSELFSLLLHSINIKCVIDKGTGTIHPNEPNQMHIITFGDDTSFYKYIGTFDNIHHKNNINEIK